MNVVDAAKYTFIIIISAITAGMLLGKYLFDDKDKVGLIFGLILLVFSIVSTTIFIISIDVENNF